MIFVPMKYLANKYEDYIRQHVQLGEIGDGEDVTMGGAVQHRGASQIVRYRGIHLEEMGGRPQRAQSREAGSDCSGGGS